MKRKFACNASTLKSIACVLMLVDHMGMMLFPSLLWLRMLGRLAFPIFAYQIARGAQHTRNFKKYALRLGVFALLSEIPFDLAVTGRIFSTAYQSVMLTLLLGLFCCGCVARLKQKPFSFGGICALLALPMLAMAGEWLDSDYGAAGILTVLLFYLTGEQKWGRLLQLAGMALLHIGMLGGYLLHFSLFGIPLSFPLQGFALLALPLIWADDGSLGKLSNFWRKALYLFYPMHLILLYLIFALTK